MLKLFHLVRPLGVIISIMASGSVCFGQTPQNYVDRNDALVRENAQATVDSLLSGEDQITRAPYVEAVVKAFDRYWGKGKVSFDWKSLASEQARIEELESKIGVCDSLQAQLDKDLANAQQVILDTDKVIVGNEDVMSYLRDRIQQLAQSSDSLSTQLETLEQTLAERKDTLEQRTDAIASESSKGGDVSQAYASADILIEIIDRVRSGLSTDIVSVSTEDIDQANDLYQKYIDIIGTISPDKYTIIAQGMGDIAPYRPLTDVLNRSVSAMASKFDASQNKALADELETLITTGKLLQGKEEFNTNLLTADQKAQCEAVVSALRDQERSSKNLNYLLDYILQQHPEGIEAASYDVTTDISKVVNIVNPAQSRYNAFYTYFNSILEALDTELKAVDMTIEELTEYIQLKKGQL